MDPQFIIHIMRDARRLPTHCGDKRAFGGALLIAVATRGALSCQPRGPQASDARGWVQHIVYVVVHTCNV